MDSELPLKALNRPDDSVLHSKGNINRNNMNLN